MRMMKALIPITLMLLMVMSTAVKASPDTVRVFTSIEAALQNPEEVRHLALTRKNFTVLPSNITLLTNLETLELSRCPNLNLENTFELLSNLEHLKHLDLSWNRIYSLPENIDKLVSLETLNLRENRIYQLPKTFTKLSHLRQLNLRHNYAFDPNDVFRKLGNMESLEWLDLSYCQLLEVPKEIGRLVNVKYLNLEGNGLTSLPDDFGKLTSLRKLNLSGNYTYTEVVAGVPTILILNLDQVYRVLARCGNLESLDLSACLIPDVKPSITSLPKLRKLDLSRNRLTYLPSNFGMLSALEELDLSNPVMGPRTNSMRALPASFGNLENLRVLKMGSNDFTSLQLPATHKLQKLQHLDMSWNRLQQFPEVLRTMTALEHLDLSINLVTELPDWVGELSSLRVFKMDGDFFLGPGYKLKVWPESLGQLANLEILSLNDQVVERIPSSVGRMKALRELHIRNNLLQEMPVEIGELENLEMMDLKANEIERLPATIGKLKELRYLNLSFNLKLYAYREYRILTESTSLKTLDVSFTEPLTSELLEEIRKALPGTTVIYAETRR